ncbi:type VII secretion protein EccCa [Actinocatenispora rupis]|uniref:Type VII secretion protein EccC n=1 Tax=Actinocatenispora rupis TaxID=519421 RepID=A0A8J3NH06_9ACTN|nr:type VII secretion protein EccCa [Actinocatenispora rupis]GID15449.1 type VII secretion protein EccC [Actinocatenispora rupis]
MTRIAFHRPARLATPEPPTQRLPVPAPPQRTRYNGGTTWLTLLLPLLSTVAMAGYLISYQRPLLMLLGVGFVVLSVLATVGVRWQMRHSSDAAGRRARERYLDLLDEVRNTARANAAVTRRAAVQAHPSPERLLAIARARRRVWERRRTDGDFLRLRLGAGRGPLPGRVELSGRGDPMADADTDLAAEAERLAARHATVGRQPAWLDAGACGVVSLVGTEEQRRGLARALVTQAAVLHAPEDVLVAVHAGDATDEWDWAKWLPHTREPGAGTSLIAADVPRLVDFLERERDRARDEARVRRGTFGSDRQAGPSRRLLLVLDGYRPDADWARTEVLESLWAESGPELGITIVCLCAGLDTEPSRVDGRATVADGVLRVTGRCAEVEAATPDLPDPVLCGQIARSMAPLRLTEDRTPVLSRITTLPEMLGVADVGQLDPRRGRVLPGDADVLRVPVGVDGEGEPVLLDLKESAQRGMGPHGLVVGATGSGKSELLRTLVTGLAARHGPELLSFVLVDFKGGATFAGVTDLPHVGGLITNLADDLGLVDRVRAALVGEQQRRQRLLRDAGNLDSVREYQVKQAAGGTDVHGEPLEPLPYLVAIVDEFGELLSARPDFIDLFVQIGRVGRSLGMHLLLATQRLEESRLRGLQSHLSYRICLRTFSAAESRVVLGTPDAYHLPPVPGSAYLKVDESQYRRFRVAHVSGPYRGARRSAVDDDAVTVEPIRLRPPAIELSDAPATLPDVDPDAPTELAVAVRRLSGVDTPVHQVWLPPLPPLVPLGALTGPIAPDPDRGLAAALWPAAGALGVPVGVVDLPEAQRQEPLVLDLSGPHGNLAVVGAPQSGKSTLLRTLAVAGMLTHTPDEMHLSLIDYGGGSLLPLGDLPHVTGAASRLEPTRVRRMLAEAMRLVVEREELFRAERIGSIGEFRRRRQAGTLPAGTRTADLLVVVDNWPALRGELDDADAYLVELGSRGLGVGVHLVLSANRWVEIRANLRDSIGGRLELRLNDPYESEVGRAVARVLTTAVPGRGATAPGVFFQAAVACVDEPAGDLGAAQAELAAAIAANARGRTAPRVRMLPDKLTAADLATPGAIGLDETDLAPVRIDLTAGTPHLLVFGDSGAGRSEFLRTWMRATIEGRTDDEVRFMVVDYRRSLVDAAPDDYIGAYAGDPTAAAEYARQLAAKLASRRPPTTLGARQLRERSWWEGPELYLVVDDADMVGGGASSPLAPLVEYLPQARETGFHVVLARRSAGAARSLMAEPLLQRLHELGADGLLMSGDPREGVLLGGQRPAPLPPGRGMLVRRGHPAVLVQVALDDSGHG